MSRSILFFLTETEPHASKDLPSKQNSSPTLEQKDQISFVWISTKRSMALSRSLRTFLQQPHSFSAAWQKGKTNELSLDLWEGGLFSLHGSWDIIVEVPRNQESFVVCPVETTHEVDLKQEHNSEFSHKSSKSQSPHSIQAQKEQDRFRSFLV